jgi:hypothetical protein
MNVHQEIVRYLPAQATAAAFIPVAVLLFNKLSMRRTVHKQRDLREKVVALNAFMSSMAQFPDASQHHAACLQDALRQRSLILTQLASMPTQKSWTTHPLLSRSGLRRLFLLYAPSGAFAWTLHVIFFFFLVSAITGMVRILLHDAYLRPAILIPLVACDFVVALLLRLASFYVDRPKPQDEIQAINTA